MGILGASEHLFTDGESDVVAHSVNSGDSGVVASYRVSLSLVNRGVFSAPLVDFTTGRNAYPS